MGVRLTRRGRLLRTAVATGLLLTAGGRVLGGPEPVEAAAGPVVLAFAGDVHAEGRVGERLVADPGGLLGALEAPLAAADLAVVNLETPVTARWGPAGKRFVFRALPALLDALADGGVDVVSVANNHALDHGWPGLADTLAAAGAAGLAAVGGGEDERAALAPVSRTVRGHRVAVLAATQVLDSALAASWAAGPAQPGVASAVDDEQLVVAVRAAAQEHDTVAVVLHWGVERQACPPDRAKGLARRLADAGADVVVGSHAHVLSGHGRLGSAYVHHGLGNAVWYRGEGATAETGVLSVTVDGEGVREAAWTPAVLRDGRPQPVEAPDPDVEAERRACAGLG